MAATGEMPEAIADRRGLKAAPTDASELEQWCRDAIVASPRALAEFKAGKAPIVVATDVASRGLDVKNVEFVVNYTLANDAETHVHRIGRTGRFSSEGYSQGTSVTFVDQYSNAKVLQDMIKIMDDAGHAPTPEFRELAANARGGGGSRFGGGFRGGRR